MSVSALYYSPHPRPRCQQLPCARCCKQASYLRLFACFDKARPASYMYRAMVSKKKHKLLPSPPSHLQQPRKMLEETRVWLCMLCWHHTRTYVTHHSHRKPVCRMGLKKTPSSHIIVITPSSPHLHSNPIKHSNKYYEAYCTDKEDGRRDKPSAKHDQISSACNLSMGYHCYMLFVIPDVCCSILGLYSVERLRYSLVERFSPHRPCRAPV